MKKNTQLLLGFALLLGVSGIAYYQMNKKKKSTESDVISKDEAIGIIIDADKSTNANNGLLNFDTDYLVNWAKSIKNKASQFIYKGKSYLTLGGRAVK